MSDNGAGNAGAGCSSPGGILRRCREYHGTTLEEAAEATKIAIHHLQALEEDQIGEFANLTYLKGFLRVYAGFLGLNPDDLMRLYERKAVAGENGLEEGGEGGGPQKKRARRFPWQKLALPAILLLLLLVTSAILNRAPERSPVPATPRSAVVAAPALPIQPARSSVGKPAETPAQEKEEDQAQAAKHEETPPENAASRETLAETSRGIIVRLKVVQNGTLVVAIDGTTYQNYDLASGDVFEWKADRTISLELSNAASVEATLNGKPLKPFGHSGSPAYVVLDASGAR